jgi:hypothetical protein
MCIISFDRLTNLQDNNEAPMASQDGIESSGELSDQSTEIETEVEEIEEANSASAFFASPSTKINREDSGFIDESGCAYLAPIFEKAREEGEIAGRSAGAQTAARR